MSYSQNNVIVSTIDFNKQLMEMLCHDNNTTDDDNTCLISGEVLEKNYIKLNCGHQFNYNSIFNEIKHQKQQNHLEITKLKIKQIKCPYCRKLQDGILPWREGFEKIKYVNWPLNLCFKPNICCYIFKSGKKKGQECKKKCFNKMCKTHETIIEKQEKKKQEKKKKEKEKAEKNKKLQKNVYLCSAILKSGKRKNQCCGAKINIKIKECLDNKVCKRHLKKCLKSNLDKKNKKNKKNKKISTQKITNFLYSTMETFVDSDYDDGDM